MHVLDWFKGIACQKRQFCHYSCCSKFAVIFDIEHKNKLFFLFCPIHQVFVVAGFKSYLKEWSISGQLRNKNVSSSCFTCSPMDPLWRMGAVRMRFQTTHLKHHNNPQVNHMSPVHQWMSWEVKSCVSKTFSTSSHCCWLKWVLYLFTGKSNIMDNLKLIWREISDQACNSLKLKRLNVYVSFKWTAFHFTRC